MDQLTRLSPEFTQHITDRHSGVPRNCREIAGVEEQHHELFRNQPTDALSLRARAGQQQLPQPPRARSNRFNHAANPRDGTALRPLLMATAVIAGSVQLARVTTSEALPNEPAPVAPP